MKEYKEILDEIPFEVLKEWCDDNLTVNQRREISQTGLQRDNAGKFKKCYLFDIDGCFLDEFQSREDAGEQIAILTKRGSVAPGYVSYCLREGKPIYKKFWVTDSRTFDKEKYKVTKSKRWDFGKQDY